MAVCLLAAAGPAAQASSAGQQHGGAVHVIDGRVLHRLPAPTHLWVIPPRGGTAKQGGTAKLACAVGFCNTELCLSNDSANCLSAADIYGGIQAVGSAITTAYVIYQWITNRQGKNTAQSKGDNDPPSSQPDAGDASAGLCLASWPHSDDSNDRVYYTTNCFGNPAASWVCVLGSSKYNCHWYNVEALDIHRAYELTQRNLRQGAQEYTKPQTSGDWQQWTIFG